MTYCPYFDKVILFGGSPRAIDGQSECYNDTWAYDFNLNQWMELNPGLSPAKRVYGGMVFNSISNKIILWGGRVVPITDHILWEYDFLSNRWKKIECYGGPDQSYEGLKMMFDDQNNELIIIYGIISSYHLYENILKQWKFSFNANSWFEFGTKNSPPAAIHYGAVFHPELRKVVMFGGFTEYDPTELLDGTWILDLDKMAWKMH